MAYTHKTFLMNMLNKYMHNHSFASYVKEIPDMNGTLSKTWEGIPVKGEIFLQKAIIAAMQRVTKKHFVKHMIKKHPEFAKQLNDSYTKMIEAFDNSQEILRS